VIEEIARRRGYGSFPDTLLPFRPSASPRTHRRGGGAAGARLLVRWGFLEARTPRSRPRRPAPCAVLNPLSQEEAYLRTSLAGSLVRRVEHNFAHGVRDVRLFEIGTVFRRARGRPAAEQRRVAAAFSGARAPAHWSGRPGAFDVFDLKALLEELAAEYPDGRVARARWTGAGAPPAGEGRRRRARMAGGGGGGGRARVGRAGAGAGGGASRGRRDRRAAPTSRSRPSPGSERDLALLVPFAVTAAELEETIRGAAGALLEAVFPFDLYEGKGLPEGTRSLAWRLRFRAGRAHADGPGGGRGVDRVLAALEERHGVRRR
jgi:phenylalanyl-tRNA synthetase beta chain